MRLASLVFRRKDGGRGKKEFERCALLEEKREANKKLWEAIKERNFENARRAFGENADVNARNENGWTPLMWAVNNFDYDLAEFLINQGADVNAAGPLQQTALMIAARLNCLGIAKMLLDNGADAGIEDGEGMSALAHAACAGSTDTEKLIWEKMPKDSTRP